MSRELDSRTQGDRYLSLMMKIEHLLKGQKVDVVLLNTAPPLLRYEVLRHGKLIYEADRQARVDFEVYAGQQYEDVRPMNDFFSQALLRELEEGGLGERRRGYPRTTQSATQ